LFLFFNASILCKRQGTTQLAKLILYRPILIDNEKQTVSWNLFHSVIIYLIS
jgi:hypothetical protein